jgi:hypothetical protein
MAKTKAEGAVTDEELTNLSDEEREALEDEGTDVDTLQQLADEGDKGDKGKNKAEAGEDEDEGEGADQGADKGEKKDDKKPGKAEDADEDEDEDEAAAAAKKGEKKEGKEAAADAGAETEDEEEDDEPEFVLPRYTAPAVEKYDEKVMALDTRQTEAEAKFKAGDLELDGLLAEQRKIEGERRALNEAKLKHDISVEQSTQADVQSWQFEIGRFMHRVKQTDSVDYKANRTLNAAFDQAVKDLGNAKDKDGKFINAEKPGRWFLREAHKQVMKDIGREKPAAVDDADETPEQKAAKAKAAAAARKTDPKKLPKTLARVPAADADDAGGDPEFSALEGLEGLELEDAVARMTPAQQDKWARSTGAV